MQPKNKQKPNLQVCSCFKISPNITELDISFIYRYHCSVQVIASSCRSDCITLLMKCLEGRNNDVERNARRICMIIMPNPDQSDCITASTYTDPFNGSLQRFGSYSSVFFFVFILILSNGVRFSVVIVKFVWYLI